MEQTDLADDILLKIEDAYQKAREAYLVNDDKGQSLKMFRVVLKMLGLAKKDIDLIKKDVKRQKQLLLAAAATPIELPEGLAPNTDHDLEAPQIAGNIVKKKSYLADDLDSLITKLYERTRFNETAVEGSIKGRQEYIAKLIVSKKGIGGIIRGLQTMPGIKSTESVSDTLGLVAKNSKVLAWLKEKEVQASAKIDIYRNINRGIKNVREKQKDKDKDKPGSSFVATAGQLVVGGIFKELNRMVTETVEKVKSIAKGAIANSRVGRQLLNETTRISDDLHEMSSGVKSFGDAIKNKVNGGIRWTTKVIKGGYDILGIGEKALTSIVNSAIPTAAVFLLTGGNIPLTVAYLTTSTGIKTYLKILDDPNLSSIKVIRNAQIRYGRGLFYDVNGRLKLNSLDITSENSLLKTELKGLSAAQKAEVLERQSLVAERIASQKVLGRLDTKWLRAVESADALFSWAPIGAAIGSYFFGAPVIGAVIGSLGGLGIRAITNAIKGGRLPFLGAMGTLPEASVLRFIAEVPFTQFAGQYMTNMWMGMQMEMIKDKYNGDVGTYFRDNWWPFYNGNIFKSINVLANVMELGGIGLSIRSGIMGNFLMKAASRVFGLGEIGGATGLAAKIGLSAPQVTACYIAGSMIGLLAAVLLGIPIGPGMLLGAAIGGGIGCGVGIAISLAVSGFSSGFLSWTSAAIITGMTALGTTIGSWFGSMGDKAIGLTGGMLMNFMQGLLALVQMLALLRQKISLDNVMPVAIGLITLVSTLYRMGVFDTANQCLEDEYCPPPAVTTGLDSQPDLLELKAFGVYLISPQGSIINSDTTAMITSYLEKNVAQMQSQFVDKTIFINLTGSESFMDDKFVILGIDLNTNYSNEAINNALDQSILKSANALSPSEIDYAFLNIK